MTALSWDQVAAWRARRHHLDARVPRARMLDVVSRLCGVHAQIMSSAELTLWARVADLERDVVQRALWEERRLVKQWAMRGTLHLLRADELPLWQGGPSTYRHSLKPGWFRGFGITEEELEELIAAVARALDGTQLTREELAVEVDVDGWRGWMLAGDAAEGRLARGAIEQEAQRLASFQGATLQSLAL